MVPAKDGGARDGHLRALFDAIDDGYCMAEIVLDGEGRAVDYRFLEVNTGFERMTGLVDAAGRTARELVPNLEDEWVSRYAEVALGDVPTRFEQGSLALGRWFDVFAVPVAPRGRFALVFRDETARHAAREALQESESRYREAAESLRVNHEFVTELTELVPGILRVFDVVERRTVHVSGRTEAISGYAPAELLAMGSRFVTELVHSDDVPAMREHQAALTTLGDGETETLQFRLRHRDGSWRWIMTQNVVLHRTPDGAVRQVLGIGTDITETKAAEEALRAAAREQEFRLHLGDVLRALGDPVSVQSAATRVLGERLGASRVHYVELDDDLEHGEVQTGYHPNLPDMAGRHRLADFGAMVQDGVRSGRRVVVDDVATDARLGDAERAALSRLQIGAYVFVPLVKNGRTVAALAVQASVPRAWTPDELRMVDETAERTWSAVQRARAEATLNRRRARAELVADLLSGLEREPSVAAQLQRLAELLVPRFADFATVEVPGSTDVLRGIAHRDPTRLETLRALRVEHRLRPDNERSVASAAGGRPQLIATMTREFVAAGATDPTTRALLLDLGPRSHMAVPVELGGGIQGALVVGISDPDRPPYDEQALAFLVETAERAGVVLAAARLRQEEHDIAVRLQRALLPDRLVWHPDVVIDARYEAANDLLEVGGDWYDTFAWPGGQIGVIVGDVVGHNLDSAATMGRLRAATAALATTLPPSPADLLDALEQFARGPDGTDYATAACVVVDPATGILTYSVAGHPPPVVVRKGAAPQRLTGAQAPPVCALSSGPRPQAVVALDPGDVVILYSDGLVERRREPLDAGVARLEAAAQRLVERDLPGTEVSAALVAELGADAGVQDDVVVACLRWTPVIAQFHRTLPAQGVRLSALRRELREWMATRGLGPYDAEDVLLCLGEACGNVVEHAYQDGDEGPLDVRLTDHGTHLTGRVRDAGHWRREVRRDPLRGRGTGIMRDVSTRFDRSTGPAGTEIVVTLPVRTARALAPIEAPAVTV